MRFCLAAETYDFVGKLKGFAVSEIFKIMAELVFAKSAIKSLEVSLGISVSNKVFNLGIKFSKCN